VVVLGDVGRKCRRHLTGGLAYSLR
jgi:hypothetical protein